MFLFLGKRNSTEMYKIFSFCERLAIMEKNSEIRRWNSSYEKNILSQRMEV